MSSDLSYSFPTSQLSQPQDSAIPAILLNELAAIIERRTMMQFSTERRNHFISTISSRARAAGSSDPVTYIKRLTGLGGELEMATLIDELTINETTFFRTVPQLNFLSNISIPELVRRKVGNRDPKRLNVWSAACSTGQEVYTLAMIANEAVRFFPSWEAKVFGTDISTSVLDIARRGVYPKTRLDTMPPLFLQRYFDVRGGEIEVKESVRRNCFFQQHNLNDTLPPGPFDVIFCRNVMIYFSRQDQERLAQRFKDRLTPGGFLFIGHSESLQGLNVDFQIRIEEGSVAYQKG